MTSKKYTAYIVSFLYVFIVINIVLWNFLTKDFITMSEIERNSSKKLTPPLTEEPHYTRHHTELTEYIASGKTESFDLLTLGDSFSAGEYQDYLLNQYGITSINANWYAKGIDGLYMLLSSGIIDELKPRIVILESVERYVQSNLGRVEVIPINMPRDKVIQNLPAAAYALKAKTAARISSGLLPPVFVQWNINFLSNKIRYMLDPEKLGFAIYAANLDRGFFTNPGYEDKLFFYHEDLNYLKEPLDAETANKNLNNAARMLKNKGIKLIFFAAVDKYDLYYPYITDKRGRPENTVFQKMRDVQGKEYIYVDTITPLREALARGEQDVYWLHDSHWSHKGIKIFCDELVKYILPELR